MDVFALLFIASFTALVITLAVMHIRKCMSKGDITVKEEVETIVEKCYFETVSDVATKWKLALPHHKTRVKLRNKRQRKK